MPFCHIKNTSLNKHSMKVTLLGGLGEVVRTTWLLSEFALWIFGLFTPFPIFSLQNQQQPGKQKPESTGYYFVISFISKMLHLYHSIQIRV